MKENDLKMKHFLKIYFSTILLFTFIGVVGVCGYLIINRDAVVFPSFGEMIDAFEESEGKNLSPLERAIKRSSRINILLVGKEHVRTDTIMILSYDKDQKKANIISIPRDTYYAREGYDNKQHKKINAVYQSENIEGLKLAVENITGIPIHKYVCVDYEAVIKTIDIIGGVEFDVPLNMRYNDPFDDPPLEINISQGLQDLDGETALKLLRFRQNNDKTGYADGDLDRIKTQQAFIRVAAKKALGYKLPSVINEAFKYIDTNFTLTEVLSMATSLIGFSMDNVEMDLIDHYTKTIDNLSYVIPNESGIRQYLYDLYGVEEEQLLYDKTVEN
jgi:LCP family protein required for cell wall assembly